MVDRGQVILVGAVLVAVIFVSLAFVVNAAISTDTLSVEGTSDVRDDGALRVQEEVRHAVRSAIEQYQRSPGGNFGTLIDDLKTSLRLQYGQGDQYVRIVVDSPPGGSNTATITLHYDAPGAHHDTTMEVTA